MSARSRVPHPCRRALLLCLLAALFCVACMVRPALAVELQTDEAPEATPSASVPVATDVELVTEEVQVPLIQDGAYPDALPTAGAQDGDLAAQAETDLARSFEYRLLQAIEAHETGMGEKPGYAFPIKDLQINKDQLFTLYANVLNSHPELWYVSGSVSCTYDCDTKVAYSLSWSYAGTISQINAAKAAYDQALENVLSWVPRNGTAIEQAKAVHDWLVRHCAYNTDAAMTSSYRKTLTDNPWSAYGALVAERPVCQGYTMAFLAAMQKLGIPCTTACKTGDHIWNRIRIGNTWYHVDVTWDDPLTNGCDAGFDAPVSTDFFLLSDDAIRARGGTSHAWWTPEQPICADTSYDSASSKEDLPSFGSSASDPYKATPTTTAKRTSIAKAKVSGIRRYSYTGKKITQSPIVVLAGVRLTPGVDYRITYQRNTKPGVATMYIWGKGRYKGKIRKTFRITRASVRSAKVTSIKVRVTNGKAKLVKLVVMMGGKRLRQGARNDYVATLRSVGGGRFRLKITGRNNYCGTLTKTFAFS